MVPSAMSDCSGGASAEIVRKLVANCCIKAFEIGGLRATKRGE
jgi:hypothetical protein